LRAERSFPACTAPRTLTKPRELTGKPLARQAIRHVPPDGTCRCFAARGQKCNRAAPYVTRFARVLQNFLSKTPRAFLRCCGKPWPSGLPPGFQRHANPRSRAAAGFRCPAVSHRGTGSFPGKTWVWAQNRSRADCISSPSRLRAAYTKSRGFGLSFNSSDLRTLTISR